MEKPTSYYVLTFALFLPLHIHTPSLSQDVSAEKFEESPIIFGDFMKMGADPADRIYEELTDMKKVFNVLSEVSPFLPSPPLSSSLLPPILLCPSLLSSPPFPSPPHPSSLSSPSLPSLSPPLPSSPLPHSLPPFFPSLINFFFPSLSFL